MDKEKIIEALENGTIEWRRHALERMLERDISRSEVKVTLRDGEISSFPSVLGGNAYKSNNPKTNLLK